MTEEHRVRGVVREVLREDKALDFLLGKAKVLTGEAGETSGKGKEGK